MGLDRFSFTSRLIALVTVLCVGATLISSGLLIWVNYRTTVDEAGNQGENISRLLAKSARLARALPNEVEDFFAQHMIVSAQLLSDYIEISEKAGLTADEINRRLTNITDKTVLDEFWVTDEKGHAYLHKIGLPDFTFSPSAEQQPQAHEFWPLLTGKSDVVVQRARKREIDNETFKYVGVRGIDKPRIVQVGYNANYINSIEQKLGIQRAIDNLLDSEDIEAIFIFNREMNIIAAPRSNNQSGDRRDLSPQEVNPVKNVIESGKSELVSGSKTISFISPIQNESGETVGAALIRTSTAHINALVNSQLQIGCAIAALTAMLGAVMANLLARRQAAPIISITQAARNVEARQFTDYDLDDIEARPDEVGQLARVFKQLSLDFLDKEKTLDAQVKERTNELIERNNQLETLSTRLSKYLSPQIYSSLFRDNKSAGNNTKRKKLTVFFSDIVNFSDITEQVESEDITRILNEYLNEMAGIALKHGATIDKYVGDAVMIFFGDPETMGVREDARACILMALEMQEKIKRLALSWQKMGFDHPFQIRIGINTGYCTVGDFGSNERMDYTIIGHQVNLAARLEQAAKPGTILISHDTYALVKDLVDVEEREPLFVKGNSRAIHAFSVTGLKEQTSHSVIQVEASGLNFEVDLTIADRDEVRRVLQSTLDKL
jgi:adenylate cyclase